MSGLKRRHQLLHHRSLKLMCRAHQLWRKSSFGSRSRCAYLLHLHQTHHSTSRSASSAPASFIPCKIEITSLAVAPICCNSCTRSSTVAPSFNSIRFTGLSCACTVVCCTTWVVPCANALGCETLFSTITLIESPPWRIDTG